MLKWWEGFFLAIGLMLISLSVWIYFEITKLGD